MIADAGPFPRLVRQVWLLAAFGAAVGLDQWTKLLVRTNMALYDSFEVLGNFFKITYIHNTGIVFGLMADAQADARRYLLLGLSLAALGFLGYVYSRSRKTLLDQVSTGLILGGAAGNLFDRVVRKSVVDFCDFGIGGARFFTFNLADTALFLGLGFLLVQAFLEERRKAREPSAPPDRVKIPTREGD